MGNGASFTADFLVNGQSVSGSPTTISLAISNINFVGVSYDNSTTQTIRIDDFLLTGVEPLTVFGTETISIAGDLTLASGAVLALDLTSSGFNDLVSVSGALNAGGTLELTLAVSAPELVAGDSFDVLDFASLTGAF